MLTEAELCAEIDPVRVPVQAPHTPACLSPPSCAPLARWSCALRPQREQVYDAFLAGKIEVPGRDLCDMSGAKGRTPNDYSVYNVMLPRTYYPAWQGNIFEQRCQVHPQFHAPLDRRSTPLVHARLTPGRGPVLFRSARVRGARAAVHAPHLRRGLAQSATQAHHGRAAAQAIADQLQGGDMAVDYDQILAKRPQRDDAVFAWHQDMAYWMETADTATATCWLAVSNATAANGCMRFVPGSHRERALRPHAPGARRPRPAPRRPLPARRPGATLPCLVWPNVQWAPAARRATR